MGPIYLTKRALIVIAILLMQSMVWSDAEIMICIFYLTRSVFLTNYSVVKLLPAAISFNQDQNQALSVRALQEIISSNDAEAVSSFFMKNAFWHVKHQLMNTKTQEHAHCTTTLFWSCSGQRPWFRPQDSAVWQRYPAASQQQWHVKHDLSHILKSLIPVSKVLFWAFLVHFQTSQSSAWPCCCPGTWPASPAAPATTSSPLTSACRSSPRVSFDSFGLL